MEQPAVSTARIRLLGLKVGMLLALIPVVVVGLIVYALYARGVFEGSQRVTLIAEDAEGVSVGMLVTFSGFPIGQVADMALTEEGRVRVDLRIRASDMRWLRRSSEFTLEKPIFGEAKIRVASANLADPPLTEGQRPQLKTRDAGHDVPQVIARANGILDNIERLTGADSALNQSVENLKTVTARMTGEYGVLGGLTGSDARARRVLDSVEGVATLVASLNRAAGQAESVLARADQRMFGEQGLLEEAQRTIGQLGALLADARDSLRQADAILADAQTITTDARTMTGDLKSGTRDLAALRADVEDSIRKVGSLVDEIDRKWPFARKAEIMLP